MRVNRRLILTGVAGLIGIAATCSLGAWQLRRASTKEALQVRITEAETAPPVPVDASLSSAPDAWTYRHVTLKGRWLPGQVVYLDNRPHDGRAGFYVLMPLRIRSPIAADVVVNRGWLPRAADDRTRIAPYRTTTDDVTIDGVVLAEEPRLLELGRDPGRHLNGIWQNFDFDDFVRAGGHEPVRLIVRQDRSPSTDGDGLDRDWPDRGGALQSQIDRHHGYAFQWFGLAATLAALLLFQLVRSLRHARSSLV